MAAEAVEDLRHTLGTFGLKPRDVVLRHADRASGADATFSIDGRTVIVEVKSVVAGDGTDLVRQLAQFSDPVIVVADRISAPARQTLRRAEQNFFDRRGHLRLVLPAIRIDVDLPNENRSRLSNPVPLAGAVAKELALVCLSEPDHPHGLRPTAQAIDRSPAAIHEAARGLKAVGLLTDANEAVFPELFWELAAAWHREPVAVARAPWPDRKLADSLGLGLVDVEETVGWALTDTVAAGAWGAPVVVRGGYPPDFYVPDRGALHRAMAELGEAHDPEKRGATVAVAPVPFVCRSRVSRPPGSVSPVEWPMASHVVVALDLAQDRARGREILEQWHPEAVKRVW